MLIDNTLDRAAMFFGPPYLESTSILSDIVMSDPCHIYTKHTGTLVKAKMRQLKLKLDIWSRFNTTIPCVTLIRK